MTGIVGDNELAQLGHRLRQAGDKGLMRELRRGAETGMKPLSTTIRSGSPEYTPKGYEATFAQSLLFKTSVKTTRWAASVQLVVVAQGSKELRQIREINRGQLKHPVRGRYRYNRHGSRRKNPWVWQRVRAGFFDDPVESNKDNITQEMRDAMHRVGQQITKG